MNNFQIKKMLHGRLVFETEDCQTYPVNIDDVRQFIDSLDIDDVRQFIDSLDIDDAEKLGYIPNDCEQRINKLEQENSDLREKLKKEKQKRNDESYIESLEAVVAAVSTFFHSSNSAIDYNKLSAAWQVYCIKYMICPKCGDRLYKTVSVVPDMPYCNTCCNNKCNIDWEIK